MKLNRLRVQNFQAIEGASLVLGDLTMLYGLNGHGKTSLIDAIDLALTGHAARDATLPQIIKQGFAAMEIEIGLVDGEGREASIVRRRTVSGGTTRVNGHPMKEDDVTKAIQATLGVSPDAIHASLRAQHLLALKPDKLLALITQLTGATLSKETLAAAYDERLHNASANTKIALPSDLNQFAAVFKQAEGARQASKRAEAQAREDLLRLPDVDDAEIADLASEEMKREGEPAKVRLNRSLRELRAKKETLLTEQAENKGAIEARKAFLKQRIAELDVPMVEAVAGSEERHGQVLDRIGQIRIEQREERFDKERAESTIRAQRLVIGEANTLAAEEEDNAAIAKSVNAESRLVAIEEKHRAATAERERILGIYTQQEQSSKKMDAETDRTERPCSVYPDTVCPLPREHFAKLGSKLKDALKATKKEGADQRKVIDEAAALIEELKQQIRDRNLAQTRHQARLQLADAEKRLLACEEKLVQLEEELRALTEEEATLAENLRLSRDTERNKAELRKVRDELALLDTPEEPEKKDAGEKPEDVQREISKVERILDAVEVLQRRALAEDALTRHQEAIADADAIAKACSPTGLRAKLIAQASAPFLDAANAAMSEFAPDYRVSFDDSDGLSFLVHKAGAVVPPQRLSDGECMRLLYTLQFAAAKLSGVRFLALDKTELLDQPGKDGLKRLIGACLYEGFQVVLISSAAPPANVPPGRMAYIVERGSVREIPRAEAAA